MAGPGRAAALRRPAAVEDVTPESELTEGAADSPLLETLPVESDEAPEGSEPTEATPAPRPAAPRPDLQDLDVHYTSSWACSAS